MNKQTVTFSNILDQIPDANIGITLGHGWGHDRLSTLNLLEMFIKFLLWPISYVMVDYVIQISLYHITPVKL